MIASLPAMIVPFNVAPSCVMLLAARVATVGGITTTAIVVKFVLIQSEDVSSHTALTSTV